MKTLKNKSYFMKNFQFLLKTMYCVAFLTLTVNKVRAQKIVQFSQYRIYQNDYGRTQIRIEPHTTNTKPGVDQSKYQKNYNVYGVLICYTVNGKKRAKRLDMTSDLKNNGYFESQLGTGSDNKIEAVNVTYFNIVDIPRSEWPKKNDCF